MRFLDCEDCTFEGYVGDTPGPDRCPNCGALAYWEDPLLAGELEDDL